MNKDIVKLGQEGERLCKTIGINRLGNPEITYHLEPSGRQITETRAQHLIRTGAFVPTGDGLFDDSQTWKVRA